MQRPPLLPSPSPFGLVPAKQASSLMECAAPHPFGSAAPSASVARSSPIGGRAEMDPLADLTASGMPNSSARSASLGSNSRPPLGLQHLDSLGSNSRPPV